ncbi:hypothetical protein CEUSTIGMA_g10732.t1, partial [Chlamydomonas eustigma]
MLQIIGSNTSPNGILNVSSIDKIGYGCNLASIGTSGYVGIGTSNPKYNLDVSGTANVSTLNVSSSSYPATAPIIYANGYNGPLLETYFLPNDRYGLNLDGGIMRMYASSLYDSSALALSLNNSNTFTDLLYVTHDGNVGIGTTTPQYVLDVAGSARVNSLNVTTGGVINTGTAPIYFPTYNGSLLETFFAPNDRYGLHMINGVMRMFTSEYNANSALAFSLNSNNVFTDILYVTHGGNVGIGTTNPQYTLDVNGTCYVNNSLNVGTVVQIDPSGSSVFNNRFVINNTLQVGGGSILSGGANVTNGSLTVPNGNIGIGTTTPQYNLDVVGDAHVSAGFVVDGLITANDNLYFASTSIEHGIYFAGTPGDTVESMSQPYSGILNRLYDPTGGSNVQTDNSELLLFQFNDFGPPDGPDRIRHLAGAHEFQVYTGASVNPTDT